MAGTAHAGEGAPQGADILKVFISYSRRDMAFADEMVAGLELLGGFDVAIDREDIHEGEAWQARLGALIADADTVVFVLSTSSAASRLCEWEVSEAQRLSKRVLPVLAEPLDDVPAPKALAELNYVRFDGGRSFMAGLAALRQALRTDIGWLREHTRLAARAQEWVSAGKATNRLLVGEDIANAKSWLDRRPKDAPPPTELHYAYIQASDEAEVARLSEERKRAEALQRAVNRTRAALAGAIVLAIAAAGAGLWAYRQQQQAERATIQAEAEKEKAELATIQAETEKKKADVTQSRYLSGQAFQLISRDDHVTAMLLSLAALPDVSAGPDGGKQGARPFVQEAEQSLFAAVSANRERPALLEHAAAVTGVAYSPDGRHIVTSSADNSARVWKAASGERTLTLTGHAGAVRSVAYSADGNSIATASDDGTVRLWDGAAGREKMVLQGHSDGARAAAFSPDGRRVASASADATVRVWDADSGQSQLVLRGHDASLASVVFSPDGARILSGSDDGTARIWDATTGLPIATLEGHTGEVHAAAFSPDGRRIATASQDRTARLWDATTGRQIARLAGHERGLTQAAFSSDGARLLTVSDDRTVRLWDVESSQPVATLRGHVGAVTAAAFSPDGRTIASASQDGTARLWEAVVTDLTAGRGGGQGREEGSEYGVALPRPVADDEAVGAAAAPQPAAEGSAAGARALSAIDQDFSYYPPGEIAGSDATGRRGDRYAYLPHDIAFPIEVPPGQHAFMNSVIYGRGGGGWAGKGAPGGSECDPANYDRHQNRDNYCEARGFKMLMCPSGVGHQGQDIRPPTCKANHWWAVAVEDGVITLLTSNTTLRLRGASGTEYDYLHLHPDSMRFKVGDTVLKGERLGRVANIMGGKPATAIQLHFHALQSIRVEDKLVKTYVPVYASLIAAYRRMKGLGDSIDENGNLIVDLKRERDPASGLLLAELSGADRERATEPTTGRLRQQFPTTQALVDQVKRMVARCLTPEQAKAFYLAATPPRWCITGHGRETERDAARWRPKWPYHTADWREWQLAVDRGETVRPPIR